MLCYCFCLRGRGRTLSQPKAYVYVYTLYYKLQTKNNSMILLLIRHKKCKDVLCVDLNAVCSYFLLYCKKMRWPIMLFVPVCYVSHTRVGLGSTAFLSAPLVYPSLSVTHMPACLRLWFQQSPPSPPLLLLTWPLMSVKDNNASKFLPGKNPCALFVKNEMMQLHQFNRHVRVSMHVQLNECSSCCQMKPAYIVI